jgi:MFS family permease
MSTVILSDHVPFHKRGIYQAINNLTLGIGATLGASLGGIIADNLGWRWAFFLQLPLAAFGICVGVVSIKNPRTIRVGDRLQQLDYPGSVLLVLGLTILLTGLNMGGNELPWSSSVVLSCFIGGILILALFIYVEGWVATHPVLPLSMLSEKASMTQNVFAAAACTSVVKFLIPR